MEHRRRGHEQICEEIRRGGGSEQYHAEKKYKEAVAVAVAKCADDTRDGGATLSDLREAVTTLEETVPIVRRVLGGAHPTTRDRELDLQDARAALRAREPPPPTERALRDARAALRATP